MERAMKLDQSHADKILEWRESLTKLSDQQFFDLFRMYLGEIKTPYNKQNLIEDLSSILRKEENKEKILSLLSYQDILILSAIDILTLASYAQLNLFFHDSFSSYDLEVHLQNLAERLLIFRRLDPVTEKQVYSINPLLIDSLQPYIGTSILFPESKLTNTEAFPKQMSLNPYLLASVYSFVFQYPDICKLDGTLKKKFSQIIPDVFPQYCNTQCFETLLFALKNLGLFRQIENEIHVDHEKWKQFSLLSELQQQAYIASASTLSLPRTSLVGIATSLYAVLNALEKKVFTKKIIKRIAFVFFERANLGASLKKSSKLRTLLQQSQGKEGDDEFNNANLIDSLIDYGMLEAVGIDDEDEILYRMRQKESLSETKKLMHFDSGFFISILPGLNLYSLLSLARAMDLHRCDTTLSFEISKQSVTRAFETGMTPNDFFEIFEAHSVHALPQNIYHAMQDWYTNFKSGSLYKGFVLHVDEDKIVAVENNVILKNHLLYTLAPGVYLMDFSSEEEAHEIVRKSGLDFIGRIKSLAKPTVNLPLTPLRTSQLQDIIQFEEKDFLKPKNIKIESQKSHLQKELQDQLLKMDITKEQREDLALRIKKKIIFTKEQLRADSVRYVKTEAKGMDFLGKIALVEQAITSKLRIEIRYEGEKEANKIFIGKPVLIEKLTNDALVHLEVEEKKEPVQLSVGGASLVKLIRVSFVF